MKFSFILIEYFSHYLLVKAIRDVFSKCHMDFYSHKSAETNISAEGGSNTKSTPTDPQTINFDHGRINDPTIKKSNRERNKRSGERLKLAPPVWLQISWENPIQKNSLFSQKFGTVTFPPSHSAENLKTVWYHTLCLRICLRNLLLRNIFTILICDDRVFQKTEYLCFFFAGTLLVGALEKKC